MPRRSIIREHLFEDSLAALNPDPERADAYVGAAEFVLSADPLLGTLLRNDVWMLPMSPVRDCEVWLYYSFDEESVHFLAIAAP